MYGGLNYDALNGDAVESHRTFSLARTKLCSFNCADHCLVLRDSRLRFDGCLCFQYSVYQPNGSFKSYVAFTSLHSPEQLLRDRIVRVRVNQQVLLSFHAFPTNGVLCHQYRAHSSIEFRLQSTRYQISPALDSARDS
jgi:hypothetical protein